MDSVFWGAVVSGLVLAASGLVSRLVGAVLVIAGGVLLGSGALPASSGDWGLGTVKALVRNVTGGWNDITCADQPEACLQSRANTLEHNQSAIEEALIKLREQSDRLAAV